MTEFVNATHKQTTEDNKYMADGREKAALRKRREADAWALLEAHGTPPTKTDFRGCRTEVEVRWAKLGGSLATYRQIFGEDDREADAALESLKVSLGVATPTRAEEFVHLSGGVSFGGSARDELRRFDAETAKRRAVLQHRANVEYAQHGNGKS